MCWYKDPNLDNGQLLIQQPFGSENVRLVVIIIRGIVGGLGFILYYYTISVLPLGDAVTLLSLSPVITVLAAAFVLNETIRISHVLACLASLIGSIFLARPSFLFGGDNLEGVMATKSSAGYLTGFLGAACGAAVYILIRRAGKGGVHTLQLLFSWSTFGFLYSFAFGMLIPMVLGKGNTFILPPTTASWMYITGACISGSMGHFLMNYAGRHAPAGLGSITRSSGIMWSYLLEVLVFHQVPRISTIFGVTLIVASLVIIAVEKHQGDSSRAKHVQKDEIDEENIPLQLQSKAYIRY